MFNVSEGKPVSTQIDLRWNKNDLLKENADDVPYCKPVGNLMFLQIATRSDIAFAVSILSRRLDNPTRAH